MACLAVAATGVVACGGTSHKAAAPPGPTSTSSTGPATSTTTAGTAFSTPPTTTESGPAGGPVPAGFTPASVTFVAPQLGWVLGTAPCATPPCTSIVRTRDGGRTWVGIPAPKAALSTGGAAGGVHRIRFADANYGWVFGPDLWATRDGGAHWASVTLPGVDKGAEVSDLAVAAGAVHVAVIDPKGVQILTSEVGTDGWKASPTVVNIGAGPVPHAQIVLQANTGWLIEVDRTVIGGAQFSNGAWTPWKPPCADVGGPAVLDAASPTDLVAVCDEGVWTGASPPVIRAYTSADGGASFRRTAVPLVCCTGPVASGFPGTAVSAGSVSDGTAALFATFDGGATWERVFRGSAGQSFTDVGFTSRTQGVAVAVGSGNGGSGGGGSLLMTIDGGHTWNAVPFR
jgi:photosystem II stability/assembly factor-like uncharacterized protein